MIKKQKSQSREVKKKGFSRIAPILEISSTEEFLTIAQALFVKRESMRKKFGIGKMAKKWETWINDNFNGEIDLAKSYLHIYSQVLHHGEHMFKNFSMKILYRFFGKSNGGREQRMIQIFLIDGGYLKFRGTSKKIYLNNINDHNIDAVYFAVRLAEPLEDQLGYKCQLSYDEAKLVGGLYLNNLSANRYLGHKLRAINKIKNSTKILNKASFYLDKIIELNEKIGALMVIADAIDDNVAEEFIPALEITERQARLTKHILKNKGGEYASIIKEERILSHSDI